MKTNWITSGGRSSHSDRVDILATQPEIALDFRCTEAAGNAPDADPAPIVARIIVNPHMAKRLAGALADTIAEHERAYGSIDEEAIAGGKLLLGLIRELGVPHGFEYSFKMCDDLLMANRYLVTMEKTSLGDNCQKRVIELCAKLRAPQTLLESIGHSISAARMVHFGFEASEKGGMHKVYLEYPLSALARPTLLHASFKWDPLHPERRALGSYVRHPLLTYEEVMERLRELFQGCREPEALETADQFLQLAMPRLEGSFHYLEVTEEGTPRKSFDVNLYSASLTMGDIRPLLLPLAARYRLSVEDFGARLDAIATRRFGHLTGGIDREGRDFFTIHFGVEPRRQ